MTEFDENYFVKMKFSPRQIAQYFKSAEKNLMIAESFAVEEVIFKFSYDAMIKAGISLLASEGYKIRSRTGHHIKIIDAMSEILRDESIKIIGNRMRIKRNKDMYGDDSIISNKECKSYLDFIKKLMPKVKTHVF